MTRSATKGRGRISVIASTIQVVLSGAVFFFVFRYLYDRLGIELIGIWSLVLATTSISRIGELGLSAGVVRFVAQAISRGDSRRAAAIVETSALTLAVVMGLLLLLAYPACGLLLDHLVPAGQLALARSLLPYALVSLWINVAASVFSGALDGCHRIDLRCYCTGGAHLLFLVLVVALTPEFGLLGVAMAQLAQAVALALVSWILLRRELPVLSWVPSHWNRSLVREIIGYGFSFQAISIMNLLFEPVAKALLGKFGGLASLGYFEMANKLLLQGRSVIVEAGRILVPAVASLSQSESTVARELFIKSYSLTFFVSVLFYGLLGTLLASISVLWIGHLQPEFLLFALMLNAGWFVNTLAGPAYFSNLGSGHMRHNVASHAIMGLVASSLGYVLGGWFGGFGVVAGTVLGLIIGSLYLIFSFLRSQGLPWLEFMAPRGLVMMVALALLLGVVSQGVALRVSGVLVILCSGGGAALLLLSMGWFHPLRRDLLRAARP
jgi:O-antigen/teichoic acid export membrane protein